MDINERRRKVIALIQALIDGKKVQWYDISYPRWVDVPDVNYFNVNEVERWRVKPERECVYRIEYDDGSFLYTDKHPKDHPFAKSFTYKKFVEELSEGSK